MIQHHPVRGAPKAIRGFLLSLFGAAAFGCGAADSTPGPLSLIEPAAWAAKPNLRAYRVLATFQRPTKEIVELGTAKGTIATTPEHPFALAGAGWVKSADLKVGDRIVSAQPGPLATIKTVSHKQQSATVYNLTVEDAHAYFVGPDALLVHNTCGYTNFDTAYKAARHYLSHEHPGGREVIRYTGNDYTNFNKVLRGQTGGMSSTEKRYWEDKAAKAEQALKDAANEGLNYKGDVYRGIDLNGLPPQVAAQLRGLRPGDGYSDPAFLSSSPEKSVAEGFAGSNGVILQIHSKHAGIAIEGVTHYPNEREVLFPPGTKFVCTGRHTDPSGNVILELEEV